MEVVVHAVWSPCSQFIAVVSGCIIQVRVSNTLERVSTLELSNCQKVRLKFLAFSPDGCLLACNYR